MLFSINGILFENIIWRDIMEINKQYKRDIYSSYMVLEACYEEQFEARMLMENEVEGILPMQIRNVDSIEYYYYDISSKQLISNLFERGQLVYQQIKGIVEGIFEIIDRGREYLLNENDFILDTEYMYITLSNFKISLCYYPGYNMDISTQLTKVIEYLMDKADHTDEQAVMLVYGLYKMTKQDCTIESLKRVIEETNSITISSHHDLLSDNTMNHDVNHIYSFNYENNEGNKEVTDNKRNKANTIYTYEDNVDLCDDNKAMTNQAYPDEERKSDGSLRYYVIGGCFIATILITVLLCFTVLKNDGGNINVAGLAGTLVVEISVGMFIWQLAGMKTVKEENNQNLKREELLNEEQMHQPDYYNVNDEEDNDYECETILLADYRKKKKRYTLRSADEMHHESVEIVQMPFIVGKLKDKVDYVLEDDAISRMHAKIDTIDNDELTITDLNSKNGTFINGERLLSNETRKIQIGDEIAFADLQFILQ